MGWVRGHGNSRGRRRFILLTRGRFLARTSCCPTRALLPTRCCPLLFRRTTQWSVTGQFPLTVTRSRRRILLEDIFILSSLVRPILNRVRRLKIQLTR